MAPFLRLRAQVIDAQLVLRGEGFPDTARRLHEAFERFAETLTGASLFDALSPNDERNFAALSPDEQGRYADAAKRLMGEP